MRVRIGTTEYGNLGRDMECTVKHNPDMELKVVPTRCAPENVKTLTSGVRVYRADEAVPMKDKIDVLILCGGNSTDLPVQIPEPVKYFNVVDSSDTHARIPEHFNAVNGAMKENSHVGITSVGWDLEMFPLNRLYAGVTLLDGYDAAFWGKGVSQGCPDVIWGIDGMKDARQYTILVESALKAVRTRKNPGLTAREKYTRGCLVVTEKGAGLERIEKKIMTMSSYLADYDTTVHFISEEELVRDHAGIPHGGVVIRSGETGWEDENNYAIEYSLKLDSNPESTAPAIVAYARVAHRLNQEGQTGCKTVFNIAPAYLNVESGEELRKRLL